ncbi:MAG: FkbM family methyltransferase [Candidatus Jordarchaeum sp.]|uniref:FkbM family methyltransferase n=1 Tax=Candidatus Jordarchaeum sp. TaxID=2823881 RepID=UPI0040491A81
MIRPFSGDLIIIKEIFFDEIYERSYRLKKGDVVIDVGAHIGVFTLKASRLVDSERLVISVEPDPENYAMLLTNIRINSLKGVIPVRVALMDESGTVKMSRSGDAISHSVVLERSKKYILVPALTLDELLGKLGVKRFDFIKIDVEGAELQIMKGSKNNLISNKPSMAIASYHYPGEAKKVVKLLNSLEFGTEKWEEKIIYAFPNR